MAFWTSVLLVVMFRISAVWCARSQLNSVGIRFASNNQKNPQTTFQHGHAHPPKTPGTPNAGSTKRHSRISGNMPAYIRTITRHCHTKTLLLSTRYVKNTNVKELTQLSQQYRCSLTAQVWHNIALTFSNMAASLSKTSAEYLDLLIQVTTNRSKYIKHKISPLYIPMGVNKFICDR